MRNNGEPDDELIRSLIHDDVDISNNAFYCCENLKQVILTGDRIKCSKNSFYHSKIEELTLKIILNS